MNIKPLTNIEFCDDTRKVIQANLGDDLLMFSKSVSGWNVELAIHVNGILQWQQPPDEKGRKFYEQLRAMARLKEETDHELKRAANSKVLNELLQESA